MNQQFECTKIKDGLYLGNIVAAHVVFDLSVGL